MNALRWLWQHAMYAYCDRRGHRDAPDFIASAISGVAFVTQCRRCRRIQYEVTNFDWSWDHNDVVGTPGVHV